MPLKASLQYELLPSPHCISAERLLLGSGYSPVGSLDGTILMPFLSLYSGSKHSTHSDYVFLGTSENSIPEENVSARKHEDFLTLAKWSTAKTRYKSFEK